MSRFARERRVFFWEEPIIDATEPLVESYICPKTGVCVVTPHLPPGGNHEQQIHQLLADFAWTRRIVNPIVWFYTPMALQFFPENITPSAVIYDCMDELSMFRGAPKELKVLEEHLLLRADLVFTGGISLFEAKRHSHPAVHPFPSGVDVQHFAQARGLSDDYAEHVTIPRPRLGYAGVIDERIDLSLVDEVAARCPSWQFVMIGPVAKIAPESLPRRENIHWLGMKDYQELPRYFAGWDVATMPFALNDSTRFISPTKTPEYLSAGLPIISTAIRDVERPYGALGLAKIVHSADEFIAAAERAMTSGTCLKCRARADEFLRSSSWDSVWCGMNRLISGALKDGQAKPVIKPASHVSIQGAAVHV